LPFHPVEVRFFIEEKPIDHFTCWLWCLHVVLVGLLEFCEAIGNCDNQWYGSFVGHAKGGAWTLDPILLSLFAFSGPDAGDHALGQELHVADGRWPAQHQLRARQQARAGHKDKVALDQQ
jgi:hypothetical protein